MSPRARRVVFGLLVVLLGTAMVIAPVFFVPRVPGDAIFFGLLVELFVVGMGVSIAVTAPSPSPSPSPAQEALPIATNPVGAVSVYRGSAAPPRIDPITKASAKRITLGIVAALAFSGAAVPFAFHLPRWIEAEIVVGVWWVIWSAVLGVVAYRGAKVEDDHVPSPSQSPVIDLSSASPPKRKWTWIFEGISDPEGCLLALVVILVVGIAVIGAWLAVELVAPAVFLVAYRGVVRALAKAQAANTRGDAPRSALSGMAWAAVGTLPLAALVALIHIVLVR